MNELETEKNIIASAGGSEEAFAELLNFYLKPVFNFVYRICGNKKDAEDIAQDVFVKLWKNLKKYDPKKNFKAWLFSIARNTTIDRLRKRKDISFSELEGDGEDQLSDSVADGSLLPDELAAKAESSKIMEELIGKLPVIYREVIVLRHKDQFTFEEIGKITKRSANTIKSRYGRALGILRKLLNATN